MLERNCQLILVVETRACEVWLCKDCGIVHLGIGPVSLRLKLTHFLKTVETLQKAVNEIRTNSGKALSVSRVKRLH